MRSPLMTGAGLRTSSTARRFLFAAGTCVLLLGLLRPATSPSVMVSTVAAGSFHTCAVVAGSGGVRCWGQNWSGQLGDGTRMSRNTPVDVAGLSGVVAIAAGEVHTCALTSDEAVKCWGENGSGELGDGTETERRTPVDVSGLSSGVVALAIGGTHTCVLMDQQHGAGVKCWGDNSVGQLGDGTTTDASVPVDVLGLEGGVRAIGLGYAHSCAVMQSGAVKCWGANAAGQLGDATNTDRSTPVDVRGLWATALAIDGGWDFTCALTDEGEGVTGARCWGANYLGQLGDGTRTENWTPSRVRNLAGPVLELAAGNDRVCVRVNRGGGAAGVQCWGGSYSGELVAVDVQGLEDGVRGVTAGHAHTCALMEATHGGKLFCWGSNEYGQLGNGTTKGSLAPVAVAGFGLPARSWLPLVQ